MTKIDELLTHAIIEHDRTFERYRNLNSRSSNQIGFVGVILAIFGVALNPITGDGISWPELFLLIGMAILLVSIGLSIYNLTTKGLSAIPVNEFYEDKKEELDKKTLLEMYIKIIKDIDEKNVTKARALDISYYCTVGGLIISFISIFTSMI